MVLSSKNHDFCRKIFTESNISALISDLLAKGYINYDHLTALVKVNPPPQELMTKFLVNLTSCYSKIVLHEKSQNVNFLVLIGF